MDHFTEEMPIQCSYTAVRKKLTYEAHRLMNNSCYSY